MQPEHTGFCRYPRIDLTDGKDPLIPTPLGGVTLTTIARWFYTTEEHIERCLAAGITVSEMFLSLAEKMGVTADLVVEVMTGPDDKLPWQQALMYLHFTQMPQKDKGNGMLDLLTPRSRPDLRWKPRFKVKEWPKGALPNTKYRESVSEATSRREALKKSAA
jgi:hypothetical protein